MRGLLIFLCGSLLPFFAFADAASGVSLRLSAESYRPGDVVELQAEMRRAEYAEFELHVPTHPQLHFVAHTREPVRYVDGEYVQRAVLMLQPMHAGEFKLDVITATLKIGGQSSEVLLQPPVLMTVDSYAAEDTSEEIAALGADSGALIQSVSFIQIGIGLVLFFGSLVWFLVRSKCDAPVEAIEAEVGLNDLIAVLEGNAPSLSPPEAEAPDLVSGTIEQLLSRSELSLSSRLREAMEGAAYGNRMDTEALLDLLKQEVQR